MTKTPATPAPSAPQASPAAAAPKAAAGARSGVVTGAAARLDGTSPQGKQYIVAAKNGRGYHRHGHFFGGEKTVYTLSDALADRVRADGLALISPYDASRHGEIPVGDGAVRDVPPLGPGVPFAPPGHVPQTLDAPFSPPAETTPDGVPLPSGRVVKSEGDDDADPTTPYRGG